MSTCVWVVLAIVLLIALALTLGFRTLKVPRKVSEEGIEDDAVVRAYNKISR